jgi:hypothetical protein
MENKSCDQNCGSGVPRKTWHSPAECQDNEITCMRCKGSTYGCVNMQVEVVAGRNEEIGWGMLTLTGGDCVWTLYITWTFKWKSGGNIVSMWDDLHMQFKAVGSLGGEIREGGSAKPKNEWRLLGFGRGRANPGAGVVQGVSGGAYIIIEVVGTCDCARIRQTCKKKKQWLMIIFLKGWD